MEHRERDGPVAASNEPEMLADAVATASIGIEAVNALSIGLALLDRRNYALFANTSAQQMLKRRAIFRPCSPFPLVLCDPASNETLRSAILNAPTTGAALQLRDCHANSVISAVVLPMRCTEWNPASTGPVTLLAMNDLVRSHAIPNQWLSQLFGLTPAESSVTNWLVSGRTIDEYAQHRGVSLETARSQLKAVLSKTGTSRQAQLVAALSRLPIDHEQL